MSFYTEITQAEVNISKDQDTGVRAQFNFPQNLELFKGHFPANPILPGVAQIEMTRFAVETFFKKKVSIKKIKKTKFSSLIRPGTPVFLDIQIVSVEPGDNGHDLITTRVTVHSDDKIAGKLNLILLTD